MLSWRRGLAPKVSRSTHWCSRSLLKDSGVHRQGRGRKALPDVEQIAVGTWCQIPSSRTHSSDDRRLNDGLPRVTQIVDPTWPKDHGSSCVHQEDTGDPAQGIDVSAEASRGDLKLSAPGPRAIGGGAPGQGGNKHCAATGGGKTQKIAAIHQEHSPGWVSLALPGGRRVYSVRRQCLADHRTGRPASKPGFGW